MARGSLTMLRVPIRRGQHIISKRRVRFDSCSPLNRNTCLSLDIFSMMHITLWAIARTVPYERLNGK